MSAEYANARRRAMEPCERSEDASAPLGWAESAAAWITDIGEEGDYGRACVLDRPMLERIHGRRFATALDVGCGEGRFCRMLQVAGISTVGIDPTEELLGQARRRDPKGDYRIGRAEALEFPDRSFDLVVSYLTFIDIGDIERAVAEMARVLRPRGTLLIANLTSFATAGADGGWQPHADGRLRFCIDHYLDERAEWVSWRGIRVKKLASTAFPVHDAIAGRRANADTFRRTGAEQRRCRQRRPLSSGSVVFAHGMGKNR